jgi:hypothetical protein
MWWLTKIPLIWVNYLVAVGFGTIFQSIFVLIFQPVPLVTPIQGGLFPGKMIYISGVPNPTATR